MAALGRSGFLAIECRAQENAVMKEIAIIALITLTVTVGMLIFKLVDPHPGCSPSWQELYGEYNPCGFTHTETGT
jgi:hypothetical protein